MIRVFDPTDKSYESNGNVVLKPLKATIFKEDNGDYYLDIATDLSYADYLGAGNLIIAQTPTGEQPFRISNCEKTKNVLTARAWHIFYDTENYLIASSNVVGKTGQEALTQLNSATEPKSPFSVYSDVEKVQSYICEKTSLYDAIMAVLERWGGHLVRDDRNITLATSIGQDRGITVQYRKNLQEITAEEDWDEVVTTLMPVGKDGILLNAVNPNASIYVASAVQYDIPYCKTASFEQAVERDDYPSDTAYLNALVTDLRNQATIYLSDHCLPKVNYTLKANIDQVTDVGDTIAVKDERLGLDLLTQVISYTYDCILEKYTQIEFGNFKKTLSGLIPTITASMGKALEGKQNSLVSGENIKTINGQAITGGGNLEPSQMGLLDFFYPIGSYYETSDSSFNPNTAWGGTWTLEDAGNVHVSAGTGYLIGSTGGASTVTLTASQSGVPQHTHGISVTDSGTTYNKFLVTNGNVAVNGTARAWTESSSSGKHYVYSDSAIGIVEPTATANNTAKNATTAHENMPPYIAVNRWHRTA